MAVAPAFPSDELATRRARVELRGLGHHQDNPELRALLGALAAADGATWDHSRRVARLATTVGRRLRLRGAGLLDVQLAALLHDVGKIRVPLHVLRKAGPLNADEWRLVRRHPEWGAELVAGIPGFGRIAEIVLLHHERPDGRGYPFGLSGEHIPFGSGIVSACDAFEAITSHRPYRGPLDRRSALAEMRPEAGAQFDVDVIDALPRSAIHASPSPPESRARTHWS